MNTTMIDGAIYDQIHKDMALMILTLSGLPGSAIVEAGTALQVDYEMFGAEYRGPFLPDAYIGFIAMLRHWDIPWPGNEDSGLNGLTLAQFYSAWAWAQNDVAKYCLDGQAVDQGWDRDEAIGCGVVAAVSAAKARPFNPDGNKFNKMLYDRSGFTTPSSTIPTVMLVSAFSLNRI